AAAIQRALGRDVPPQRLVVEPDLVALPGPDGVRADHDRGGGDEQFSLARRDGPREPHDGGVQADEAEKGAMVVSDFGEGEDGRRWSDRQPEPENAEGD